MPFIFADHTLAGNCAKPRPIDRTATSLTEHIAAGRTFWAFAHYIMFWFGSRILTAGKANETRSHSLGMQLCRPGGRLRHHQQMGDQA
jgi:hypothetical protein